MSTVIEHLNMTFQDYQALRDVNLEIRQGEFIAILGPSGCGKTTLLRLLAGFLKPTGGTITMDGVKIADSQEILEPNKRNIGMVFQSYALWPHMTVLQQVMFPMQYSRFSKFKTDAQRQERARAMLRLVGMEKLENRYPSELSGGQKQRVAIARALVNKPKVLLLDEPLGALDLKLRKQMQIELKRLQKKLGITFIYVTHDQEEALTMSDRIAVMRDGKIEQLATPMEIYEHPITRFVAGFIGESNIFDGKVVKNDGGLLTVETDAGNILVNGEDFSAGEEMHVSIRSEYLEISTSPVDGFSVEGNVKDFIYQGSVVKTAIDLPNGQEVKYSRFEQDHSVKPGERVYVHWRPEKAVAIKKTEQEAVE